MRLNAKGIGLALWMVALTAPSAAQATEYYIDQNSSAASDQNAGTIAQPWKTITKANQTLTAGDTVYIRAGSYANYIAPANSGTSDNNRITYRTYTSDIVTISNNSYGILLNGNDYISVIGSFVFSNLDRFLFIINNADHNIVDGPTFGPMRNQGDWAGSRIYQNSNYNVVRNSTFKRYGSCTGTPPSGDDSGVLMDIGNENTSTDTTSHNLIENNTFSYGGHHLLGVNASYNVVRNNYFHNDPWTNGAGNRTLYNAGSSVTAFRNLIEGNRFGYAASPCDAEGVSGALLATNDNIFRFNQSYHHDLCGLALGSYSDSTTSRNKIYNNTFFHNGNDDTAYDNNYHCVIQFNGWASATINNAVKNNLYFSHKQIYGTNTASVSSQIIGTNFNGDAQGNPLFMSASLTPPVDKNNATVPDLRLQIGSPAVDAAGALTTITSSTGSGSSFVVADAGYFVDGWGIIQGDMIQLQGTAQRARITSVNYQSNTVMIDRTLTWTQNQGICLAYEGAAPDFGAHELIQLQAPSAPRNLRVTP